MHNKKYNFDACKDYYFLSELKKLSIKNLICYVQGFHLHLHTLGQFLASVFATFVGCPVGIKSIAELSASHTTSDVILYIQSSFWHQDKYPAHYD